MIAIFCSCRISTDKHVARSLCDSRATCAIDGRSLLAVVDLNYNWWAMQYGRFLPRDAILSAVYAVVVCLSVCMHSVCVCVCHFPVLYQNG